MHNISDNCHAILCEQTNATYNYVYADYTSTDDSDEDNEMMESEMKRRCLRFEKNKFLKVSICDMYILQSLFDFVTLLMSYNKSTIYKHNLHLVPYRRSSQDELPHAGARNT